jgi:hypothetical protein
MIKVLYVNGCSHSVGAEISRPGFYRQPYDYEHSYGGVISRKFGLIHHNDAIEGGSNNLIETTTIQSILTLLETYHPSEIFVIIGWTGYDRSEATYKNKLYRFIPNSVIQDCPYTVNEWYKFWVANTDNDASMNKFLLQYGLVSTFLKYHNIKYYFFNSIIPAYIPKINLLHEVLDNKPNAHLINMMKNDQNFLEPFNSDKTFYNILKKNHDGCKDGRWHHFTEDGHLAWAEFLLERIEELYPKLWT